MSENGEGKKSAEESGSNKSHANVTVNATAIWSASNQEEAADHEKKRQAKRGIFDWLNLLVLFLTFVAAVTAAIFAGWLAFDNDQSLGEQNAEFYTLNRAAVSIKDVELLAIRVKGSVNWYLSLVWQNTGATPTEDFQMVANYVLPTSDLPNGFSRCVFEAPQTRIPLGAHTNTTIQVLPIPANQISFFQNGSAKHFMSGQRANIAMLSAETFTKRGFAGKLPR